MKSYLSHAFTWSVVLLAIPATAPAADRGEASQARADLRIPRVPAEGGPEVTIRNQTYDLVRTQIGPDRYAWTNLLVHRQQDLVRNVQMDGFLSEELAVEVFKVEGVKKTTLFHFKEHASQSSIREDVGIFVASSYGCCDSTDTHAIYSLKNGRRLFFAGGDRAPYVLDVSWPNTDRARLVGVHVAGSSRDPEVYKGVAADERHGRILVSLASTAGLFEALALLFDSAISDTPRVIAVDWAVSTDMKVYERQLEVWPPKKGQKPAIPVVQIALSSGQKISIPLDGDRFGNVSKPDGVQVIRLAPPQ